MPYQGFVILHNILHILINTYSGHIILKGIQMNRYVMVFYWCASFLKNTRFRVLFLEWTIVKRIWYAIKKKSFQTEEVIKL